MASCYLNAFGLSKRIDHCDRNPRTTSRSISNGGSERSLKRGDRRSRYGNTSRTHSTSTIAESGSKASHDGRKEETSETTNENDFYSESTERSTESHWKTKIDDYIDERTTEILQRDRERRRKREKVERARWMRATESRLRAELEDQMLVEKETRTISKEVVKKEKTAPPTRSKDDENAAEKKTKSDSVEKEKYLSSRSSYQYNEGEDREKDEGVDEVEDERALCDRDEEEVKRMQRTPTSRSGRRRHDGANYRTQKETVKTTVCKTQQRISRLDSHRRSRGSSRSLGSSRSGRSSRSGSSSRSRGSSRGNAPMTKANDDDDDDKNDPIGTNEDDSDDSHDEPSLTLSHQDRQNATLCDPLLQSKKSVSFQDMKSSCGSIDDQYDEDTDEDANKYEDEDEDEDENNFEDEEEDKKTLRNRGDDDTKTQLTPTHTDSHQGSVDAPFSLSGQQHYGIDGEIKAGTRMKTWRRIGCLDRRRLGGSSCSDAPATEADDNDQIRTDEIDVDDENDPIETDDDDDDDEYYSIGTENDVDDDSNDEPSMTLSHQVQLNTAHHDLLLHPEKETESISVEKKISSGGSIGYKHDEGENKDENIGYQFDQDKDENIGYQFDEDENKFEDEEDISNRHNKTKRTHRKPTYTDSHPEFLAAIFSQSGRRQRYGVDGKTKKPMKTNIHKTRQRIDNFDRRQFGGSCRNDTQTIKADDDESNDESSITFWHLVRLNAVRRDLLLHPDDYASHSLLMSDAMMWTLSQS